MPVVGVDHVQVAMPAGREAEARAFYSGLLGIPEIPKPPLLAARGGAWFEDGRVKIHLGVDPDFRPARKAHAALLVTRLDTLIDTLRAAGHRVVDDEPLEGYVRVYVDDPFGNRLELMEPVFGGMTVNERLVAAGLLEEFDRAARRRDRERMLTILTHVRVDTPEWSVDTILANPARYGY